MTESVKKEAGDLVSERLAQDLGLEPFEHHGTTQIRAEGTSMMVMRAFTDAAASGFYERGYRRAMKALRLQLPPSARHSELVQVSGPSGARTVEHVLALLEEEALRTFPTQISGYHWLWMIRRLALRHMWPDPNLVNIRLMMSSLALGKRPALGRCLPGGLIPVDRRYGRFLAFLGGYTAALTDLVVAYRWIGKGGHATIDFERWHIDSHGSEELQQLLMEYDEQVYQQGGWGGLGIHLDELTSIERNPEVVGDDGPILLVLARLRPKWTASASPENDRLERFVERFVHLEDAFALLAHPSSLTASLTDTEIGTLLPLLMSHRILASEGHLTTANLRMVGYSVHGGVSYDEKGPFGNALERARVAAHERVPHLVPSATRAVWHALFQLGPTLMPRRPGPVLVPMHGRGILVDWYVAAMRFLTAMRLATGSGEAANVRGRMFEETVRAAIARTPCKAVPWLEGIVGRHLRGTNSHQAFGEFDAAASLPGGHVHVLVFCKSYPFTDQYERGDHNAVRNVSQKLVADILAAIKTAETLNSEREGANYRVPLDVTLVPIVVTPRPMFVPDGLARKRWFNDEWGPRLVSGVGGLISFLSGYEEFVE